MTVTTLTPHQAAARAKVSRGTIMNALKDGSLVGFRDNRNRWQIKPDDLSKWLSNRSNNVSDKPDNSDRQKLPVVDEKALRIAVLETELKGKDQRIADLERDRDQRISALERDRDSWKEQAQELAQHRPRRWWPF